MPTWVFIGIGGAIGAILRSYVTLVARNFFGSHFPYGTLIVNLFGSFIIGILFGLFESFSLDPKIKSMLTTGFLGALTTFSTFALESFYMFDRGNYWLFFLNIALNLIGAILFAGIGFTLTRLK